ncbi:MAG: DMT family transporter [Pseudomonadota bacterium]|nr:DMT family transporter [Pseudomonadota bacterium]MEC8087327.1 DMT family transporter [Pseudomonadota bacterium]MEC8462407.1 DMT family transporter [Pseudomonadota bacterium]MEC8530904.1 DMT family transporter [Pseudomonadota bacterium]
MPSVPTSPQKNLDPLVFFSVGTLFIFLWASGFVAAKYGLPYAEPFTLMAARFVVAAVILVPACFLLKASWPKTPKEITHILIAGFGVQTMYLTGVYYGIWFGISTGVTALVVGLQPLLTAVLAGFILKETVTKRNWLGLILGFAGLGLVVLDRILAPTDAILGLTMLILGLVGITLGTLYQKKYCGPFDVRAGVALQNIMSCIVMIVLAATFESMVIQWTIDFILAVLWSAVGLSVLAICLYYWLVQRGAAARITSLIYLSPPTTAVMGWAMFGETLSWQTIIGMIVAMIGIAMAVQNR